MLIRQKEFFQWLFSGFATAAFIVASVWLSDHRGELLADLGFGAQTTSASVSASLADDHSAKAEDIKNHSTPGFSKKASGGMNIDLTSASGRQADGSISLNAKVSATGALTGLAYDWVLPDGVSLISGSLHGTLGSLAEGATGSLDVTVSAPSATNSQVLLHVYRVVAGQKVGQIAHYNTLDQDAINAKLAEKRSMITGALLRSPASADFGRRAE